MNKQGNDCLFILGDIHDDRKNINHYFINQANSLIKLASQNYKEVHIVTGNHDKDEDDSNYSLLTVHEREEKNVFVYDNFSFNEKHKILFAPFYSDEVWLKKLNRWKLILTEKYDLNDIILMAHITIDGLSVNYSGTSHKINSIVKPEELMDFKFCLSGDMHHRQVIKKKLYFIGSFLQQHFGEGVNKGITYYDTKKDKLEFVPHNKRFFVTKKYKLKSVIGFDEIANDIEDIEAPFLRLIFSGKSKYLLKVPEQELKNKFNEKFKEFKFEYKSIDNLSLEKDIKIEADNFSDDLISYCKHENMDEEQIKYAEELFKQ